MDSGLVLRGVAVLVLGYLVGGVPWALIIGKRFFAVDVREHGSGNLGATNVYRTLGVKAAIATLLLDIAKGALAVGLAWWVVPSARFGASAQDWVMIAATMAAILGHSYSPYIGFKGGKGVATAAGALLVFTPYPWPFLLLSFILLIALFRVVSLASVLIAVEYPLLCIVFYPGQWTIIGFACVAAGLVIWRHRANIARIWRREEPKVSWSGKGSATKTKGES